MSGEQVDVLIAGGGPVGMALAHALAPLSNPQASGCMLDIVQIGEVHAAEDRPIALAWGSRLILERLGLWSGLPATPIARIHVSQQHGFGRTLITAADHDIEALGYVVGYRALLGALCSGTPAVSGRAGRVLDWAPAEGAIDVRCGDDNIRAHLLVLADGGQGRSGNTVAEAIKPYGQTAIVCDIETERPHGNTAWERFTPEGPLALLPFGERSALVWTLRTESAQRLMTLDEGAFLCALQHAFGRRLGALRAAGRRNAFALSLRYRTAPAQAGIIAIGNASQTLHPVAGQGLNLGLRDAWELAELITAAVDNGAVQAAQADFTGMQLGSAAFAQRYAARRSMDRSMLLALTDGLVNAFGIQLPFAAGVRGAALAFLDAVPPARRFLSRRMMFGARGLP